MKSCIPRSALVPPTLRPRSAHAPPGSLRPGPASPLKLTASSCVCIPPPLNAHLFWRLAALQPRSRVSQQFRAKKSVKFINLIIGNNNE